MPAKKGRAPHNPTDPRIIKFCKAIQAGKYCLKTPVYVPAWYKGKRESFIACLRRNLPPNYCGFVKERNSDNVVWVIRKEN